MTENYMKVLELVSDNDELKGKILAIRKDASSVEEILDKVNPLIGEFGLNLSMDDIEVPAKADEISDDEIDAVAGGKMVQTYVQGYGWILQSDCWCAVGGGGTADDYQKACACVLGGAGEFTEEGKEMMQYLKMRKDLNKHAMFCVGAGGH